MLTLKELEERRARHDANSREILIASVAVALMLLSYVLACINTPQPEEKQFDVYRGRMTASPTVPALRQEQP